MNDNDWLVFASPIITAAFVAVSASLLGWYLL
mgnify:CR=1 FL=1